MICPTRWTARHASIDSIITNYKILQDALEETFHEYDEYAAKASGLAAKMDAFDTFFGLKLAYLIFSASDQFAINIQSVDITVQEASQGAKALASHMQSLRSEEKVDHFYLYEAIHI